MLAGYGDHRQCVMPGDTLSENNDELYPRFAYFNNCSVNGRDRDKGHGGLNYPMCANSFFHPVIYRDAINVGFARPDVTPYCTFDDSHA